MTFQYPWMLLGLLAPLVPIVIHLINRHRAKVVRFAALERLIMSDKRLARRVKMRQWLVLALRVLLFTALPLALAKPYIPHAAASAQPGQESGAVVLVIDNSLSMSTRSPAVDGQSALEVGLAEAIRRVRQAGEMTSFAVVTTAYPARALNSTVSYDRAEIMRALERVQPSHRRSDMSAALREAERLLAETGQRDRVVVVVSDGAAHDWQTMGRPWALTPPPRVTLAIPEGMVPAPPNLAITAVEARVIAADSGRALETLIDVTNYSQQPGDPEVSVSVGELRATTSVRVAPGATERVSLRLDRLPEVLARRAMASLSTDALEEDNQFYFTTSGQGPLAIGLLNGSPNSVAQQDELYFVRPALSSLSAVEGSPARIRDLALGELSSAQLAQLDVVVMANVGRLPPGTQAALTQFVRSGGGLLIAAGDRLTVEASGSYGELLPLPLRGVKGQDSGLNAQPVRITKVDVRHPVMEPFGAIQRASLFEAKTHRYALMHGVPEQVDVLASVSGGAPVLVNKALGSGRVVFWATTLDRDWTDLVVRTSFVPLLHRLMRHLADQLVISERERRAGVPVRIRAPEGRGELIVTLPDGAEHVIEDDPERRDLTIYETEHAGHYELRRRLGTTPPQTFSVNADRTESDLSRVDIEALMGRLEEAGERPLPLVEGPTSSPALLPSHHTKLWPWVIVMLFVLLGFEAALVIRQA